MPKAVRYEVKLWSEENDPTIIPVIASTAKQALTRAGERLGHEKAYWKDFSGRLWRNDKETSITHRCEIYRLEAERGRELEAERGREL